jgi:hypothetical protein
VRALLAAALLAALAAPAAAGGDDGAGLLDRAQKAISDDIDYDTAGTLVQQALDGGGLSRADLARAHRIAGEVAAALDDAAGARAHFVRWLLLEPDATLADGMSPKITEPFEAARAEARELGAMTIEVAAERRPGKVRVTLDARDPLNLIARLRARADGVEAEDVGTRVELEVPGDAPLAVEISVLDEQGHELERQTVTAEVGGAVEPDRPPPRIEGGRGGGGWPAIIRWPTWTAVAVVAGGAGGFFAYRVGQDEDELAALNASAAEHTIDEAEAVQARGQRNALYANIGFGVAAAAAVTAILTFVLEPDDQPRVEVTPQGDGVSVSVRF